MKPSVLIFVTGLILGIAGTVAIMQDSETPKEPQSEDPTNHRPTRTTADRHNETPTRSHNSARIRRNRSPGSKHSNGGVRDDLSQFLSLLAKADDTSELDLMNLIRNASLMTMLREDEALDLLQLLTIPANEIDLEIDDELREIASVIIFCRLCELNGPEAMRLATAKSKDGHRRFDDEEFLAMGMNSWVASDPEGARQWFEGLVGKAEILASSNEDVELEGVLSLLEDDDFRASYFNGMAKHDPEGVEQRLAGIQNDEVRETLQDDLMNSFVRIEESVEGLQALLEKTSESSDARSAAVEKLSDKDPDSAARWIESQSASSNRDHQINRVANALMEKNADAGINWYMKQELYNPDAQSNRLSQIVSHLAGNNLEKAGEWLNQQPDDLARDSAEQNITRQFGHSKQWDEAMTWASGIQSEDSRNESLKRVFRNGWDDSAEALPPELIQAAEAAGLGDQAKSYRP